MHTDPLSKRKSIIVPRRFRGPAQSGNGGYVCGLIGKHFQGSAEIRLSRPPPLDHPLQLNHDGERIQLLDGDLLVGEGRATSIDLEAPPCPTLSVAKASRPRYAGFVQHAFPGCFVCGPERKHGDGLRIFAASVGKGLFASVWTPSAELADSDGSVAEEYVWAALDCPGYFATIKAGKPAVLGTFSVQAHFPVAVNREHIVVGWPIGHEGRKYFSGTAVFDNRGKLLAIGKAIWIAMEP